jgi:hypothetical protein
MDKEIIDKVMFDNFLKSVPTMVVDAKDRKTISAYGSIDVNDLRSAVDTFKKVPDYGELLKQVKKQKEVIDKIMNLIKQYGKYDGKKCTRGFQMWSADFNKILDMLKEVSE